MNSQNKTKVEKTLQLGRIAVGKLKRANTEDIRQEAKKLVNTFLTSDSATGYTGGASLSYNGIDIQGMESCQRDTRHIIRASLAQVSNYIREIEALAQEGYIDNIIEEARGFRDLAYYDQMTGLPNRTLFASQIPSEGPENIYTVLVMDIDDLKKINTLHGHLGGDAAIIHVGKILGEVVEKFNKRFGNIAVPVRLSGDEFAVSIRADVDMGSELSQLIHGALLENPKQYNGASYPIAITIGIASNTHIKEFPIQIEQKEAGVKIPLWFAKMMKHADTALEIASKGTSKIFDGSSSERTIDTKYDVCTKNIQDLTRGINTNEDFEKMVDSVLMELHGIKIVRGGL